MKCKAFSLVLCVLGFAGARAECTYESHKSMLSRVVAVDSSNGTIYGRRPDSDASDAPSPLLLNDKEIVLTFDLGPHAKYTDYILFSLDKFCVKAVFFFSGSAAAANPVWVREVAARGHTVAAGPWSPSPDFTVLSADAAKKEIEASFAAVERAARTQPAPFFRFPSNLIPPVVLTHLKERGVSLWSYDIASGDTESGSAAQLERRVMTKLHELGKGVIQFHDTRKVTVDALDDILSEVKQNGFKVVQPVAVTNFAANLDYLAGMTKEEPEKPRSATAQGAGRSLAEEARRRVTVRNAEDAGARVFAPARRSMMRSRRTLRAIMPDTRASLRRVSRRDARAERRRARGRSRDEQENRLRARIARSAE
jgi:peptidoglycan/xylan/chitin deacetylase (PgdA/CDA1 family)